MKIEPIKESLEYPDVAILNDEGIRFLFKETFSNKELNTVRDMFMLSLFLGGIDICELLIADKKHVEPNFIILNHKYGKPFPLPLIAEAYDIFRRYKGRYYALNIINKAPSENLETNFRHARQVKVNMNNKLKFISKILGLKRDLSFDDTGIIWARLAKKFKIDKKAINYMSEINNNPYKRPTKKSNLNLISLAFNKIIDKLLETSDSDDTHDGDLPFTDTVDSIVLWEGEFN